MLEKSVLNFRVQVWGEKSRGFQIENKIKRNALILIVILNVIVKHDFNIL